VKIHCEEVLADQNKDGAVELFSVND